MKIKKTILMAIASLFCVAVAVSAHADIGWTQYAGHYYKLVTGTSAINWDIARNNARVLGGDLATVTSEAEDKFIQSTFGGSWGYGAWIGGLQNPDTTVAKNNWTWVTGEAWSYQNWNTGEPNDGAGQEAFLGYKSGAGNNKWNDFKNTDDGQVKSYVVEAVPEPATVLASLSILAPAGMLFRRRKQS